MQTAGGLVEGGPAVYLIANESYDNTEGTTSFNLLQNTAE